MKHPELTPEERERLRDDFSAPAVERYAAHLLSRWPVEDAVICAQQYRDACPSSNDPRRAFWSRVIVQILSPSSTPAEPATHAADVVPSPISEAEVAAGRDIDINPTSQDVEKVTVALESDVIRDPSGDVVGFSAPRWRDEDSRRPNAKHEDPKQGSLF